MKDSHLYKHLIWQLLAFSCILPFETTGFSIQYSSIQNHGKSFPLQHSLQKTRTNTYLHLSSVNKPDGEEEEDNEIAKLKKMAEQLRQEAQDMEKKLDRKPRINADVTSNTVVDPLEEMTGMSLRNKRVLVVGANGRLGSMVCRYLLRNYPQIKECVAAVHTVSENSVTSRGYGRLSYEVGAEDGRGNIGAAWSAEDRVATFEYTQEMQDYNLRNLRLVEVELLDPVQCRTITEDVDCVIYCATDFNGNKPRAVSGLNVAFLFRAVASPTKGRVEIEGLRNILEGLTSSKQNQRRMEQYSAQATSNNDKNQPTSFVLISTADQAYKDFETPFGSFKSIKREGESILENEFPSLSKCILQMGKYDDNFVEEDLDVQHESPDSDSEEDKTRRKINRRDAARFAVDALVDENLAGKKLEVWTALR